MSALAFRRARPLAYPDLFLHSLIAVSLAPAVVCLGSYEVIGGSTILFSLLAFLSGAHVWATLAYYTDRRWLSAFREQPITFFVIPGAIILGSLILMSRQSLAIGLSLLY